jgi:hypothetical protein
LSYYSVYCFAVLVLIDVVDVRLGGSSLLHYIDPKLERRPEAIVFDTGLLEKLYLERALPRVDTWDGKRGAKCQALELDCVSFTLLQAKLTRIGLQA